MRFRVIFFLLLGFLISIFLTFFFTKDIIRTKIQEKTKEFLNENFQLKVNFSELNTNFLDRVVFKNVEIPEISLNVKEVVVKFSIFSLLFKKKHSPSLHLKSPVIKIDLSKKSRRMIEFFIPEYKIKITDGKIFISYKKEIVLKDINGFFSPEMKIIMKTEDGSKIFLKGRRKIRIFLNPLKTEDLFHLFGIKSKGKIKTDLIFNLENLSFEYGSGNFDFSLDSIYRSIDKISGNFTVKDGIWKFSDIEILSNKLKLSSSGKMKNILSGAIVDFKYDLSGEINGRKSFFKDLKGKLDSNGFVKGRIKNPYVSIKGSLIDGEFKGIGFLSSDFSLYYNRFSRPYFEIEKLLVSFERGNISANGFWGKKGKIRCKISDVKFGKFWGRFDGRLNLEKEKGIIKAYMPLDLSDIGFYPDLNGFIKYKNGKGNFYFSSENKDYTAKGNFILKKGLELKEAVLDLYGDGIVKLEGFFNNLNDNLFSLTCRNVDLRDVSFLNLGYEGNFSFDGEFSFGKKLKVFGKVNSRLKVKNLIHNLSADVEYAIDKIKISNFVFSNFAEGNFVYIKGQKLLKGKFNLDEFPLSFLKFLDLKGKTSGFVDFYIDRTTRKFNIDLNLKDFAYKKIFFDGFNLKGYMEKNNFFIYEAYLRKLNGKIDGKGVLDLERKSGRIKFSINDISLFKRNLNTDLNLNFTWKYNPFFIEGNINSDIISFDKIKFRNFKSRFSYNEGILSFPDINTEDFEGNIEFRKNYFSGNFELETKIKKLFDLFSLKNNIFNGKLSGKINFEKKEELRGEVKIDFSEVYFKDLKGKGEIDFNFDDNVLELKDAKFDFEKDFKADFSGIIPLKENFKYDLKAKIKNLPFSKILVSGFDKSSIEISVRNKKTNPVVDGSINFENGDFVDFTSYFYENLKPDKTIITSSKFNVLNGNIRVDRGLIDFNKKNLKLKIFARHIRLKGFSLWGDVLLNSDIFLKNGEAKINNFYFNGFNLDELFLKFSRNKNSILFLPYENKEVYITGNIKWDKESFSFSPLKLISGKKVLKAEFYKNENKMSLNLKTVASRFSGKDISGMLNIGFPFDGDSEVELNVLQETGKTKVDGKILSYNGKIGELNFKKFISNFSYNDEKIYLALVSFGDDFELKSRGSIYFKKQLSEFNVFLKAETLSPLFLLNIPENKGNLTMQVSLKGSLENPVMKGTLIGAGEFLGPFGKKVKDFNIKARFSGNKIVIDNISGKSPGEFLAKGFISVRNLKIKEGKIDLFLKDGIYVKNENLIIPAEGLAKKFIRGRPSYGKIKGKLTMKFEGFPVLNGDLVLYNSRFTYPGRKREVFNFPVSSFNINLNIGDNVYFKNSFSEILIKGNLNFKKELNKKLKVNGRMEAIKGNLLYIGKNFDIKRAELDFVDNVPYLEGEAETSVERIEPTSVGSEGITVKDKIILEIKKDILGKAKPTFYSLYYGKETSEEKAITLLFGSENIDKLSPEEKDRILRREIVRIFDSSLTSPIVKNLLEKAGIVDTVSVNIPLVSELENKNNKEFLEGAEFKFGKHITSRFFWGYNIKFSPSYNRNKLDLIHEFEFLYRMKGRQFLKGRMEIYKGKEGEKFLGIEKQFRF